MSENVLRRTREEELFNAITMSQNQANTRAKQINNNDNGFCLARFSLIILRLFHAAKKKIIIK